jgi:hypothetical protein
MGKYLGKTKHKRIKKNSHKSRRIQRGGTMTSAKLKYLLNLTKEYPVHNNPSEIRRITNLDAKSNSKNKKVASTIDSKDISEIIQILKTNTPQQTTAYMQRLEAQESAAFLERADSPIIQPQSTEVPFRFGDPTIPDVGSTQDFGAYRRPEVRRRPRSPRRLPPPPFDTAYLDNLDSNESVMGPWAMSVTDASHILPSPRRGMRRVVHPPAPAPYSHDASVSAISSPRGHRRAAALNPSLDVIAPSSHAPSQLYDSTDYLRPDLRDRVVALRNRPGVVPMVADSIGLPPFIADRGRGARAPSPSSPRRAPVDIPPPASPIGLATIPELPRSIHESRKGVIAPPASRDVSRLSPRASNASMASLLPVQNRGRGARPLSELDMVRFQTGDLDRGSSVAPLPRTNSRPSSALFNSMEYLDNTRGSRIPSLPNMDAIVAPASRLPSAPVSVAKAASPRGMVSPKAKKQQQKQAWLRGMFDSTAEVVARPDTEDFDFTASVAELPRASTAKPVKNLFGSDDDFGGLFPKPRLVGVQDAGPAMFARPQTDRGLLQHELEEAEQRIIDEDRKNEEIKKASRALKAKGDEKLHKQREERLEKEQAQAALKQQRRNAKEARTREDTARMAELEQIRQRTPQQQAEFIRLKSRLAFGDDDDDDGDSSGGGRRRTRRNKKRGHRSHKIKKSRKNRRNRRSGRK